MSHYYKLYDKIKQNPKDVSFKDLDKLLTKTGGFNRRNPKSGSSHYTYFHPDLIDILTIPKDRPIKEVYVKKALKLLDIVLKDFR